MNRTLLIALFAVLLLAACRPQNKAVQEETQPVALPDTIPDYLGTGHRITFLDTALRSVKYKYEAAFYRDAYYVRGQFITDSIVSEYTLDGTRRFRGRLLSDTARAFAGYIRIYNTAGNDSIEQFFDNEGRPNGRKIVYYPSGKLMSSTMFVNGARSGSYVEWYENGNVHLRCNYRKDILDGHLVRYYDNGQPMLEVKIVKGKRSGDYKEYYEDGKIKVKGYYISGERRFTWTYYDADGNQNTKEFSAPRANNSSQSSSYEDLWNECDYMQDMLQQSDITPNDELYDGMSLEDLENLRDELEVQLDENNIDY